MCERVLKHRKWKLVGVGRDCWSKISPKCTACGKEAKLQIRPPESDLPNEIRIDCWMSIGRGYDTDYENGTFAKFYSTCCNARLTNEKTIRAFIAKEGGIDSIEDYAKELLIEKMQKD